MRPVVRGDWPVNKAGVKFVYKTYGTAKREMLQRLGNYCSYCEMRLDASLAIEHMRPKQPKGTAVINKLRELDWENFLLACTNCNSTKGDTEVAIADYIWPDRDNTFRAIAYGVGGVVSAAPGVLEDKAEKLIRLVGLHKTPDTSTAKDQRWLHRKNAWDAANRAKDRLQRCNTAEFREQIVESAQFKGYWSMWMIVFQNDLDMMERLIIAFNGTDVECFPKAGGFIAVHRNGGQC